MLIFRQKSFPPPLKNLTTHISIVSIILWSTVIMVRYLYLSFLLARTYILIFYPLVMDIKKVLFFFSPVRHLIEIYRVARAYEMCRKFLHSHRQIFQCNGLTKSPRAVQYFQQCHKGLQGSFNNYVDEIRVQIQGK